ncbi:MAG: aldo/keto reductase [Anaerolineae bacterium]|jgi:predicted aldo/keto reductase-like oxidoreductase|nr:aldo/keto reductase [Chloroflexota bacterium]
MQQVPLGRTGLQVSEIAFGGIPIQRLSHAEAVAVVRHCLDAGITFIDTAHGYGTSEERIGEAIRGRREGLVLASKSPARDGETFQAHLEQSFTRLGVDYIDLYQFHNVATAEALEQVLAPGGAMEAALRAREAGRIGHIGVTSHNLQMAIKMADMGIFETMMFPFNYVTREPLQELIPLCQRNGVGFIAMKPMGGGMLEDATLSFKYQRQHAGVVPVVGIERAAEMDEILQIWADPAPLSTAEMARIDEIVARLGTRFCRRCDYCQPCPQQIPISTILNIKSFAARMPAERVYGDWGRQLIASAQSCIRCGQCEGRCPYGLPVPDLVAEYAGWYHQLMAQHAGQGV